MQVAVVTLFPEMFAALTEHGISGRGIATGLLGLTLWNPRDFCRDKHRNVDDKPFGGGPGMLMKTEPLLATIDAARAGLGERGISKSRCIYLSPQGQQINHQKVTELAELESITLVCGRYQGIDNRVIEAEIDEELSLGDFVLSGGEIAAMALLDALIRIQPGALGDEDSAMQDSLTDGLLHAPEYTRPQQYEGRAVPPVLLSGDHAAIARWRNKQRLGVTWLKRRDLLDRLELNQEQKTLLEEFKQEYWAKRA
ncbi:MAG: tRNA (guanosine(37)-N1)-methyltransferase TrmD [Gammaproteobacteria bacterium]|nr:tRNA (guanosine(37)-N1)-methyltransferase TrmD [Gammaproteobacteria bacterium]HBW84252.1 tRNA (guanosine(37)-N1)-methyltransferase TrmD [Gammaproteobacteria bacterium]|tara:strand:- start:2888 stop:3649 length:762 start_codon:yes stop_codon:yes gene_type:complete